MIEKQGKLYIDEKLQPYRYDKNEEYGAVLSSHGLASFWKIIFEFVFRGYKITISKYTVMSLGRGFSRGIMFDPPEKVETSFEVK